MARCAEFRLKIELLREKERKCLQNSSNFWEKAYILPIICTVLFPKKGLHNQKKALIQDFNPLRKIKREQLETMRTQIKNFIVLLVALVASTEGMTPNTTMTDPRDGTVYKAITFARWTWTTENMRYNIGKNYCQKDDPTCKKYGRYYGEENASQVCPEGWELLESSDELQYALMMKSVFDENNLPINKTTFEKADSILRGKNEAWIKAKRTQIIKDFFANTKCIYDTERNKFDCGRIECWTDMSTRKQTCYNPYEGCVNAGNVLRCFREDDLNGDGMSFKKRAAPIRCYKEMSKEEFLASLPKQLDPLEEKLGKECTKDVEGSFASDESGSLYMCTSNEKWTLYGIFINGSIWTTWYTNDEKNPIAKKKAYPSHSEALASCPDGWELPTRQQYNNAAKTLSKNGVPIYDWYRLWYKEDGYPYQKILTEFTKELCYAECIEKKANFGICNDTAILNRSHLSPSHGANEEPFKHCYEEYKKNINGKRYNDIDNEKNIFRKCITRTCDKVPQYYCQSIDNFRIVQGSECHNKAREIARPYKFDHPYLNLETYALCVKDSSKKNPVDTLQNMLDSIKQQTYLSLQKQTMADTSKQEQAKIDTSKQEQTEIEPSKQAQTKVDSSKKKPVKKDSSKQKQASAAAKSAKDKEDNSINIKWPPVICAGVTLASGALAYFFDQKAKDATATPPTNAEEYQRGFDDSGKNQTYRNISIGVAAVGLIAFGATFFF